IKGYKDGSFKPNNNLNRAEAGILLCRVLGIDETETVTTKPFSDVDGKSWYGGCVSALKDIKIVKGNPDGTYKPITNINRAEFLALAIRTYSEMLDEEEQTELNAKLNATTFAESFSDVGKTAWYGNVASVAKDLEFVQGRTCGTKKCFDGSSNITRAEATTVLFRIFDEML
ncbi:MAG: S-layer homology domain-containing protein, partial [Patescibacteria group bacterium]